MAKHTAAEAIGILVLGLLLSGVALLSGAFFSGWVFVSLWDWFIRPVFTAAPAVTMWQAYGIMFFVRFMMLKAEDLKVSQEDMDKEWSENFGDCIKGIFKFAAYSAVTVFIGWIAWSFIY